MTITLSADCDWLNSGPPCLPEERLRLAIFQRAVLDALLPTGSRKSGTKYVPVIPAARRSALRYLLEPVEQDWVYSLSAVAEQIGMDAGKLRRLVEEMITDARAGQKIAERFRFSRWTRVGDGLRKVKGPYKRRKSRQVVSAGESSRPLPVERLQA